MALDLPHSLGPFELLRHLASGGMGDVYLAHSLTGAAEPLCVVKTVRPEYAHDKAALRRFVDEARTSALLSHENILRVLDVGEAEGTAYIAVEYIAGRDLMAVMARASRAPRPVPESVALYLVTELLEALCYVHRATDPRSGAALHIVHRDVSPHNVLVSFEGQVKLIDFGIARTVFKGELTQVGQLVGKVRYMAPEQARGEPVDGATDIWAACVVACELLTGRRFWGERSPEQVAPMLAAGAEHRPPAFSSIPPELQRLLARGLDQDPTARPRASELRDGLRAAQIRRGTLGSAAETAALLDVLFGSERKAERAAREQVLREPTVATAAAWPENTAYVEHSGADLGADTASLSGAATRSMASTRSLGATRVERAARPTVRAARSVRRRSHAGLAAAAAGAAAAVVVLVAVLVDAEPAPAPPPFGAALPSTSGERPPLEPAPPVVAPPAVAAPVVAPPAVAAPVVAAPVVAAPVVTEPAAPARSAPAPPGERLPPRPQRRSAATPVLFGDRVKALRECTPRPLCAKSVLRRAAVVADLDVEELRDLDVDLGQCLARCPR